MIELYFASTPNAQRALIALEEAGLPYTLRPLDLLKGEQRFNSFLELNPLGAVPVLVDSDGPEGRRLVLTQSIGIILYVAERSRSLIPLDAGRRIDMFKWMMLAASDVAGTNTTINQLRRSAPDKSEANLRFFEERLLAYFASSDEQLRAFDYLASEFSLADISLYPFAIARRALIEQGGLTGLLAWMARMTERRAVAKAMSVSTMRNP